ncbi:SIMPL domain-containing protein [Arthrobacter sp. AET 35A]|uniref:SIMPL domain-containing protein n=1 Tax=Arthrobacter sp. AET 35A TaxID=2292643 RepID=UPI001784D81B|nr:SIMPL domain-containing protein [Arthrobacter sp. AET 35A]
MNTSIPGPSVAVGPSAAPGPSVTVTGSGTVSAPPDRLHLRIEVEVRRPTAPHAYLRAADAASRVLDALDADQMPPLKRSTRQIGLRAEIVWADNQEQRVSGYVASQELAVTIDDPSSASAVLDAVVHAGGDDVRINSLAFGFSDPAARARLAQEAAWQDARERALQWAQLAGCTLGEVEEVTEGGGTAPAPVARHAVLAADQSMPIEPGEAEVVSTVTVRWRIVPPE